MTRFEAETLVQKIGTKHWREYRGVAVWKRPGLYAVCLTHKASNTQREIDDPAWTPEREQVPS
jgi:hypothetical protein